MRTVPNVIIADDHVLIREGLRKLLAQEPDLHVVGEAADFVSLLSSIEARSPDVVIMDIHMPGAGGALDTLKRMRTRWPGLPVLMLSLMPESQVALDFLIAGAAGYVSKEAVAQELITAIRRTAQGLRYMSPRLSQRFARTAECEHDERLSPREQEILCLIALGLTVKEIAAKFGLSISTVHTHRSRLLQKLRLRSDIDLSRYAVQRNLISWK